MKRNARPSLFDAAVGFDDPLEMLLACHRRIERQLRTLERLHEHLVRNGVDAQASLAAQTILRYFMKAAESHHDDEEKDLFPLLEQRIPAGTEKAGFNALREKLEGDHDRVRDLWTRLRKPLEGIADGLPRMLNAADVRAFIEGYESRRPFTDFERNLWPVMLRRAALRTWLGRLGYNHFPRESHMTIPKDHDFSRRLLEHHIAHGRALGSLVA